MEILVNNSGQLVLLLLYCNKKYDFETNKSALKAILDFYLTSKRFRPLFLQQHVQTERADRTTTTKIYIFLSLFF